EGGIMAKLPIKVLLVEDNPGDVFLIKEMLRENSATDFEVTTSSRLADARQALQQRTFGVVLLDLSLPDSQGLDTLRAFLQTRAAPPVVVLTGLNDEVIGLQAVQEGAEQYLVKGQITGRQLGHDLIYALLRWERRRREQQRLGTSEGDLDEARKIHGALLP